MTMILQILLAILNSETIKVLIGLGIKKLLESKTTGITKDLAETMIDGIIASKANPTTAKAFDTAKTELKDSAKDGIIKEAAVEVAEKVTETVKKKVAPKKAPVASAPAPAEVK